MTQVNKADLRMHRYSLALLICAGFLASACVPPAQNVQAVRQAAPATGQALTYSKYLNQAIAGDPEAQYLVGYMLYFGEGQVRDPESAHNWFHQAADQGHARAKKDLAFLAKGDADSEAKVSELEDSTGRRLYAAFCAGCHGRHGIAAYQESPSFALGERMNKPDSELMQAIRRGKGTMPDWGSKFSEAELKSVLEYLRGFEARYQGGLTTSLRDRADSFFLFGPMGNQESNPEENY